MAGHHNMTMTGKFRKTNSSVYLEYGNLIKELEQYMPQFKISIKDLQEPSQSFVTDFYTDALSEFFCDVNNLTEIQVTQNLTYNEMYSETVPILNMCMALRYIYSKLGIDDFGVNDICDPSPKRVYRLLQTMINFIKYSDGKIHDCDAQMKAVKNMKETVDKLKKEKDSIINSINEKLLNRKQREAEIKIITEDVNSNKSDLMNIQKHNDEIQKELDKVKKEQSEIEKKCFMLCELKDNIIKDINALRSQIVEAPDLLKADHERLKRTKSEIIEKKSSMMAKISAKKQTFIIMEQEFVAQEKRLRLITDIIEKNEKLLKLNHEIETMLQKKSELDECSEILKEKIELTEREHADINNKINYFVKEMERERNSYKSKFDALHKEIDDMIKQRTHQCETIKSLQNEISKCNLHKKEMEDYVTDIMYNFEITKNILNQTQNDYYATVNNKLLSNIMSLENNSKKPTE